MSLESLGKSETHTSLQHSLFLKFTITASVSLKIRSPPSRAQIFVSYSSSKGINCSHLEIINNYGLGEIQIYNRNNLDSILN